MQAAAAAAGVQVVTGDTKVVQKGKADGCYINTAGIGVIEHERAASAWPAPGPATRSSCPGPIGDHGVTIMLARGELDIEADVHSDTAPLNGLVAGLLAATTGVRALRDATRGGVATILNEIATVGRRRRAGQRGRHPGPHRGPRRLRAARHRPDVRGLRGPPGRRGGRRRGADQALAALRAHPLGEQAAVIGHVTAEPPGLVQLKTAFGGTRIVDLLVGDPLPRIC